MERHEAMRRARERSGLTQRKLAELAGVSCDCIGRLERGEHTGTMAVIELLADALGLSIDEYVGHVTTRRIPITVEGLELIYDRTAGVYIAKQGAKIVGRAKKLTSMIELLR